MVSFGHSVEAEASGMAFVLLLLLLLWVAGVHSDTDPSDDLALGVLYGALNSPPQLSGWKTDGGDPCGESWKGVSCSDSAVTAIQVSGMGLNGTLGYLLANLLSLKTLDMSNNNIHETIPYQLPPNITYLNLAHNSLSGNLPYSLSTMTSLSYLNVSHNLLSQSIEDIFTNLQSLSELDLSFNNLTGDLPNSVSSLSNLSSLYLEDNQLTGSVDLLANLDLIDLNIANNHFSGWIPQEFSSIPNLMIEGNSFANGPAPPPPPYTPPPPRRLHNNHNHSQVPSKAPRSSVGQVPYTDNSSKKNLTVGSIVGIIIGSILAVLCASLVAVFYLRKYAKSKDDSLDGAKDSLGPLSVDADKGEWHQFSDYISSHAPTEWSCRMKEPLSSPGQSSSTCQLEETKKGVQEQKLRSASSMTYLKPPPPEKIIFEKVIGKSGSAKRQRVPITATSYSVATLQSATGSFSQEFLIGEGSLGRVYRAEFSNGKVLAVKKIDSAALSLQEEDNFLEAVSNMSRLRHPNITTLVGYCVEHQQRLLVYQYIGNGTLHDVLHFTDDSGKTLSWSARVRVAVGTARALEYLHEVCLPSVIHKNLKSANILLDEELNPHLSDCGLASLTPNAEKQVMMQLVGSFGYSAPEFAMSGVYTEKSDVYSFGVVMLELLTGRKPLDSSRVRSEQSLVRWATPQLHDIDALSKMVDPALKGIYPAKSLSRFADIIALCVQREPEFRPPMSEVVQALVRLMQRASMSRKSFGDEQHGSSYKIQRHQDTTDMPSQTNPT